MYVLKFSIRGWGRRFRLFFQMEGVRSPLQRGCVRSVSDWVVYVCVCCVSYWGSATLVAVLGRPAIAIMRTMLSEPSRQVLPFVFSTFLSCKFTQTKKKPHKYKKIRIKNKWTTIQIKKIYKNTYLKYFL